jgi:hypothetical protein
MQCESFIHKIVNFVKRLYISISSYVKPISFSIGNFFKQVQN